jgi:very-short-patch-repair endonuclease
MTRAGRRRRGITVHAQPLPPEATARRHRVPCTSLVRTLIDLAASVDARTLARAFEQAQVVHRLKPILLATVVLDRPGHRGTARLRPLLAGTVDPGEIDSVLELRFLRFCRDWKIDRPETQAEFGPWRADFLFRGHGLVIETDGARFHATAAARARDARKTAYLESIGLVVLRVSWFELHERPAELHRRIRDAPNGTFSPETGESGPLAV